MYSPNASPPNPISTSTPKVRPQATHTADSSSASRGLGSWSSRWRIRSIASISTIAAPRPSHAHNGTSRSTKFSRASPAARIPITSAPLLVADLAGEVRAGMTTTSRLDAGGRRSRASSRHIVPATRGGRTRPRPMAPVERPSRRAQVKSPADRRSWARPSNSAPTASLGTPGSPNTWSLSTSVARWVRSRPESVIAARVRRPSLGCARRRTSPSRLEPVDHVGDARRVDLQPLTDLAERQLAGAGEAQQHQHLVAGEREAERGQRGVDTRRAGSGGRA